MDTKKFPSWSTLPNGVALSKPTLSFLTDKLGFQGAAPVQYSVVPLMLKGKDVVVEAITGSGKTLAFLIPAMEALLSKRCQQACRESRHNVVVCCLFPTRELANQVHVIAKQMIEHANRMMVQMNGPKETANLYRVACFVGGHDVAKDIAKFQDSGAHLLLGTPGRLNELLVTCKESVCFELRNFELLVLDEADRLLECGFKPTLTTLLKRLPKQRRTALFSATQSRELADLARAGTRNPLLVTVREHQNFNNKNSAASKTKEEEEADRRRRLMMLEEEGEGDDAAQQELSAANQNPDKAQVPLRLQNWYHVCRYADKVHALVNYLRPLIRDHKILIYVMTCAGVEWLHAALTVLFNEQESNEDSAGSSSAAPGSKLSAKDSLFALHGQLGMEQRKKVHKAANAAKNATIVCSDVAARGLDLPNVRYVIQFDAPSDPRTFVHRIGRTARMGQAGDSLLFLSPMETDYIHFLQLQNVFLEKIPKRNIFSENTSNQQQQKKYAASSDDDEDDTGLIMNDDDDDDDEFDDASKIVVNKNRTLASVASDRNRLKAAKGRNAYQKKIELKQKRRSVITTGDLIENDTILTLRRSMAFKGNEALLQKAARAFVSFIRAYKEHECRHIFRLQHIDITDLTNGFALFFVPNCGEIRLMHQLVIPLQEEFDGYTKKLDSSRKEVQAARFAAEKLKKQMKEKEMKKLHTGNIDIVEGGGGATADGDNHTPLVDEDGNPIVTAATQRKKSVHELAKEAKLKIRDGKLSQKAKKKAWAQADMDELRREAFLIKKERAGKLRTDKVNELLGEDKIDHTMMSTRERRQQARRRTRSE